MPAKQHPLDLLLRHDEAGVADAGLPDWPKLREVGHFNARYLHMEPQQTGREPSRRPA